MIKSFADRHTETLFCEGVSKKMPPQVVARALRKLDMIDAATVVDDVRTPPGNRLHQLKGNRVGQHAICINDQWRICFAFDDGNAYDVEICDYH